MNNTVGLIATAELVRRLIIATIRDLQPMPFTDSALIKKTEMVF